MYPLFCDVFSITCRVKFNQVIYPLCLQLTCWSTHCASPSPSSTRCRESGSSAAPFASYSPTPRGSPCTSPRWRSTSSPWTGTGGCCFQKVSAVIMAYFKWVIIRMKKGINTNGANPRTLRTLTYGEWGLFLSKYWISLLCTFIYTQVIPLRYKNTMKIHKILKRFQKAESYTWSEMRRKCKWEKYWHQYDIIDDTTAWQRLGFHNF